MIYMFLDESGECSFSSKTEYDYFLITILTADVTDINKLKNRTRRFSSNLINIGWEKTQEIKAVSLHKNRKYGDRYIFDYIKSITTLESLKISYLALNKNNITNESFKRIPYGIGYNYFTGRLLTKLVFEYGMNNAILTYDERNKESHPNQSFQDYLLTLIYGKAFDKNNLVDIKFIGADSRKVYGLTAVDFFCWSIYRKITAGDYTYYDTFSDRIIFTDVTLI